MIVQSYLQPHEDISGIDRTDDQFVGPNAPRQLILQLVDQLYGATLVGSPAPKVRDLYERMTKPRPGDRVVAQDALFVRNPDSVYRGVGYLVAHRAEWWTSDEQWQREIADGEVYPDEPRPVERNAWYIQYGPNAVDVCRWVNCTVLAIPESRI